MLASLGWRLAIERDTALDESARARQSMEFLVDLLKWAKPTENRGDDITVEQALTRGIAQLESARNLQPRHEGELALVLGGILLQRRERAAARPLLERAYTRLREAEVDSTQLLAESALQLASALGDAGDRARSLALLDEVLRVAGSDPALRRQVLSAYRVRSIRLSQQGDHAGAQAAVDAGVRAADAAGAPDADRLELLALQASLLGDAGNLTGAVETRRRIHELNLRSSGADHPDTSAAANLLANALIRARRLDEAAPVIEADVALRRRLWGDAHVEYARGLNMRAFLAFQRGDLDPAQSDAARAVAIARADVQGGRAQLSAFLELLGLVEARRGQLDAAEVALRDAVDPELAGASLSPDHGRRRLALVNLLVDRGKHADALRQLDAVDPELASLDARHPRRAIALGLRAKALEALGDREGALRAVEAALVLLPEDGAPSGGAPTRSELMRARERLGGGPRETHAEAPIADGATGARPEASPNP
jgi:tetratricopeptide (TPR) repeat protein